MKIRIILFLSALFLSVLACKAAPTGGSVSNQPQPGGILFQDDFSDPSSGWDKVNVSDGVTDYTDGVYRIYVNTSNTDVWSNPGLSFTDARVEVDATKVDGADDNDYGVICRYQDSENFYFFVVSSDGYYGIGKVVAGKQQLIGVDSMPPSEVIKKGNDTNHLSAECVGSSLSLSVNDQSLAQYDDTEFTSGDVGLIAGTFDTTGVDIHFDNFVVSKP
jgi:hypothetical protein